MEMRFYYKKLCLSYKDHVNNEEVRAKIQQAIRPHEDLLTIVKRRRLQWYGHVFRSSGLVKNYLARHSERGRQQDRQRKRWEDNIREWKGERRQGRQRKRWEDNIREWTGLEFANSQTAVENREKWRTLVVKFSVVPQRPSRLRDR